MIKLKVKIQDINNIPRLIKAIRKLNNLNGKVGYHAGSTLEMIARVHEFGARIAVTDKMRGYLASQGLYLRKDTTHITIPERSFLRTGTDLAANEIERQANLLALAFMKGSITEKDFLETLALVLKGKIQEHAVDLSNPINHPFTVEMKGSDNPLVDSGELIEKLEVEVE